MSDFYIGVIVGVGATIAALFFPLIFLGGIDCGRWNEEQSKGKIRK
jgi:hypothetical protein